MESRGRAAAIAAAIAIAGALTACAAPDGSATSTTAGTSAFPSHAFPQNAPRTPEIKDLAGSVTKLRAQRTVALSELEALDASAKVA